jgi:hypothetical protein
MITVSESTIKDKAFKYIRKQVEGDDPYKHIANLYASIETNIAYGRDVPGCRLIRSMLDELVDVAQEISWLKLGGVR